jgi:hypothetical protein
MTQPMTKHDMFARVRLVKIMSVLVIGAIAAIVLHRMYRPSSSKVCDHVAELAPNSVVQPKIDRAFNEVPEAAKQTSPAARCEAYFTALRDDPHDSDDYSERSGCVLDAKTLSSVAACLEK